MVTLECRGTGARGVSDSSASASNWSGSALSPLMRKKPAMVAERKMRITRSGHMSCFSSSSPPLDQRNRAINQSSVDGGKPESGKAAPFGLYCFAPSRGAGALAVWRRGEKEEQWRIGGRVGRLGWWWGFFFTFSRGGARRRPPNAFSPNFPPIN